MEAPEPASEPHDEKLETADSSSYVRDKLEFMYEQLLSLLEHEGRFVSERFAHAITVQSILFAAFFLVITTSSQANSALPIDVLQLIIAGCGLAFAVVYCSVIARTLVSMTFWRSTLILIEKDPRFWQPEGQAVYPDYDIFSARMRLRVGTATRQSESPFFLSKKGTLITTLSKLVRDPHDFYAVYFPLAFSALWIVFAVSSIRRIFGW